ncbi:hypothetical protein TNCV_2965941 [Trichonephila clavipes]|nr:hypothetical protein TNCV_2965941 [Trichonephila clavipes]
MISPAKEQNVLDSKRNREFQIWWTEKYGITYISKDDKAADVLCSGIVTPGWKLLKYDILKESVPRLQVSDIQKY